MFCSSLQSKAASPLFSPVSFACPVAFFLLSKREEKVNADREAHSKKPFDNDDDPSAPTEKRRDNTSKKKLACSKKEKPRTVTKSLTDPDCGLFVLGEA